MGLLEAFGPGLQNPRMDRIRIGLMGPSRTRQGLGPFLARFAEIHGGAITACLGSSEESGRRGASELAKKLGHEVRPYRDLDSMIAGEESQGAPLQALIIASPHHTHEGALQQAAAHGLHVLCEKPLIWGGEDLVQRTEQVLEAFTRAGLVLQTNTQWPYTLPAYFRLFPSLTGSRLDRFACRFSPISRGSAQIPDALPHPLSLLQALSPTEETCLHDLWIDPGEPSSGTQNLAFTWPGDAGAVACEVRLEVSEESPRPAAYGVQGYLAHREIQLPAYELAFRGDLALVRAAGGPASGCVELQDPMESLVQDFLSFLRFGHTRKPDYSPLQRIRMLQQVQEAYEKLSDT